MTEGKCVWRTAVCVCAVLLVLAQQVCAGPIVHQIQTSLIQDPGPPGVQGVPGVQTPRRVARMTPLWRIMNSKPFGAYCQNNYECSTGLCRAGHCSNIQRAPSEAATI